MNKLRSVGSVLNHGNCTLQIHLFRKRSNVLLAGFVLLFTIIGFVKMGLFVQMRQCVLSTRKETVAEINEKRKQVIRDYCLRRNQNFNGNITSEMWKDKGIYQKPRFFFTDSAELLFCETPKCGTTQWRDTMLVLDGLLNESAIGHADTFALAWKHSFLWERFDTKKPDEAAEIDKRLQQYFKFMTTREPLERLVSAYRDKLENPDNSVYAPVSRRIHKFINKTNSASTALATFEEFLDAILLMKERERLDPHWRPYTELCYPCHVKYDFIARMETIYDDAAYIADKLGIHRDRIGLFNETGNEGVQQRRTELYHHYFSHIPLSKRNAIFLYYKDQYDIFGYEYPKFINVSDGHEIPSS